MKNLILNKIKEYKDNIMLLISIVTVTYLIIYIYEFLFAVR